MNHDPCMSVRTQRREPTRGAWPRRLWAGLAATLLALLSGAGVLAGPGELDPDFALGGTQFAYPDIQVSDTHAMIVGADGRIWQFGVSKGRAILVIYQANGQPVDQGTPISPFITPALPGNQSYIAAAAEQANGKVVAVGGVHDGTETQPLIVRFNADGSLDGSFGTDGWVVDTNPIYNRFEGNISVLLQPDPGQDDDRIIVASTSHLTRYAASGAVDASFSAQDDVASDPTDNGVHVIGEWLFVRDMAWLDSDTILVAGTDYTRGFEGGADVFVAHVTADGATDTSFGAGAGFVSADPTGQRDTAAHMAMGPGGSILLAGRTDAANGGTDQTWDALLVKLDASGALDTSFSDDGWLSVDAAGLRDVGAGVVARSDGGAYFGVYSIQNPQPAIDFTIYAYQPDGSADADFGSGGLARGDVPGDSGSSEAASAMAVQADGKLLIGGLVITPFDYLSPRGFGVARVQTTGSPGSLDPSFGTGGAQFAYPSIRVSDTQAVLVAPNGRIWQFGVAKSRVALVIYETDGQPVEQGTLISPFVMPALPGNSSYIAAAAAQADGKVVAVGGVHDGTETQPLIVRFNADGSLDGSFGTGGWVVDTNPIYNRFEGNIGVLLQPVAGQDDDKIIVASTQYLTRYMATGAVDASFSSQDDVASNPNDNGVHVIGDWLYVRDLAWLDANSILVAGTDYRGGFESGADVFVAHVTAEGAPDTSFGSGAGFVSVDPTGQRDTVARMAMGPGGSILLAGRTDAANGSDQTWDALLVRLSATGALDTSFSGDGWLTVNAAGLRDVGIGVATRPDGKTLFGVYSIANPQPAIDFTIYAFLPDGSADLSFGAGGLARGDVAGDSGSSEAASAMAVQADGQLLIGGLVAAPFDFRSPRGFGIARFDPPQLDADADGMGDAFESSFGGSTPENSVTISSNEANAGTTTSGSAETGATIDTGSVEVAFPAGTSVESAAAAIEIEIVVDATTSEARLSVSGADLGGGTKTIVMPFDATAPQPAVCIDDSASASIETVVSNGICTASVIAIPATVGSSNTVGPHTVTRISSAPARVQVAGLANTALATLDTSNLAPSLGEGAATVQVDEGQTASNGGSLTDANGDVVGLSASVGTVANNGDGSWSWSFDTADGPSQSQTVTIDADDGRGGTDQIAFDLVVANTAPNVTGLVVPIVPIDVANQSGLEMMASFNDAAGALDAPFTCRFDRDGDGEVDAVVTNVSGSTCSTGLAYDAPGVYRATVTVEDKDAGVGTTTATSYVVIYDADGGFVTGGGWIDSPAGAFAADPDLTGKATFGFVAKYKPGKTQPEGNTEFHFQAGDLRFQSTGDYMWLVVSGSGHKATYKGTGTVNGGGNYGFMVTAIDAANTNSTNEDLFRIKIWNKDAGDGVIYDNHCGSSGDDADPCTALGGGNIKIHKN
ncbi:MAG: hypothetical protein H6648_10890 [Caldilineae bacterium]|nr:hypothetical protein [Caldilineae bacterium]